MGFSWQEIAEFTVKKLFGYQTAEKIRQNLYYLRDEMTDLIKGLQVDSDGGTTISIKADVITVKGIKLTNVDLTIDISITGTNGRDGDTLAAEDIWFLFIITDDTGSVVAGYASKTSDENSLTLPAGYTRARLISFCKLDENAEIRAFAQRGRSYSYWAYISLFDNLALPNSDPYLSYDVSPYAPTAIVEEVEVALYAYGTSATNDSATILQRSQEKYNSDTINSNYSIYLYGVLPISPADSKIEFGSALALAKGSGFVKGATLKI